MSDIDRLTVVVGISFILLIARLPERDFSKWGFLHLTSDLFIGGLLFVIVAIQIMAALHLG